MGLARSRRLEARVDNCELVLTNAGIFETRPMDSGSPFSGKLLVLFGTEVHHMVEISDLLISGGHFGPRSLLNANKDQGVEHVCQTD